MTGYIECQKGRRYWVKKGGKTAIDGVQCEGNKNINLLTEKTKMLVTKTVMDKPIVVG